MSAGQLIAAICIVCAAVGAVSRAPGWGWFLLVGVLLA